MRVLVIHNFYQHAGGEDAVFESEAELLRHYGHETFCLTESNEQVLAHGRLRAGIGAVWSQASWARVKQALAESKAELTHFHNFFMRISPSAYYACRERRVPVVQTLHNYRLMCPGANFYRDGRVCTDCLERGSFVPAIRHACYRQSRLQTATVAAMVAVHRVWNTWNDKIDLFIALSEFSRSQFIAGGLPPDKIFVKSNFVHPDPGARETAGNYALFLGRLSGEKGLTTLLHAWHALRRVPLKIVGDGELSGWIANYVAANDLQNIELTGRLSRAQAVQLLKGARCLIVPSTCYENFPMAVAEAYACGVPVIASRHGALAEIVDDGRTGLHFTAGEAADLAATVERAWTQPRRLAAMGKEARREFENKYTAGHNHRKLMTAYEMAIANSGRRAWT